MVEADPSITASPGPIVGVDGRARCPWATSHPLNLTYHDTEWGLPVHGEAPLLERITLEAFQSGLSWLTILAKRPAFRRAFHDFEAERVAALTEDDIGHLMQDTGIVRNRAKILAARTNAQATIALRAEGGLDAFLWAHRPADSPRPRTIAEVPTTSPESSTLARELRAHGFVFVGPTTVHALMEAVGMIDAHLVGCFRRGAAGARR